jgi:hypothetical protein
MTTAHDPSAFFNAIDDARTPAWLDRFMERAITASHPVCPTCGKARPRERGHHRCDVCRGVAK